MFDGQEYALIPKKRLSRAFTELVREISAAILEYDPIGLKDLAPKDEYDSEAASLAAQLRNAKSEEDVKAMVLGVIGEAFGEEPDAQNAALETAAREIWRVWSAYLELAKPQNATPAEG